MCVRVCLCAIVFVHVKVSMQISKSAQPVLTSVEVVWQQFDDTSPVQVCDVFSKCYHVCCCCLDYL